MQYLLTEQEYNNLEPKTARKELQAEVEKALPTLLKAVKCHKFRDKEVGQGPHFSVGYCDNCPLQDLRRVCTYPRNFSK